MCTNESLREKRKEYLKMMKLNPIEKQDRDRQRKEKNTVALQASLATLVTWFRS